MAISEILQDSTNHCKDSFFFLHFLYIFLISLSTREKSTLFFCRLLSPETDLPDSNLVVPIEPKKFALHNILLLFARFHFFNPSLRSITPIYLLQHTSLLLSFLPLTCTEYNDDVSFWYFSLLYPFINRLYSWPFLDPPRGEEHRN